MLQRISMSISGVAEALAMELPQYAVRIGNCTIFRFEPEQETEEEDEGVNLFDQQVDLYLQQGVACDASSNFFGPAETPTEHRLRDVCSNCECILDTAGRCENCGSELPASIRWVHRHLHREVKRQVRLNSACEPDLQFA